MRITIEIEPKLADVIREAAAGADRTLHAEVMRTLRRLYVEGVYIEREAA